MDDLVLIGALSGPEIQHLVHQPTIAEVLRIDHAAVSKFHTLTRIVHPSKVKVECGLDNTENNRNRIPVMLRSKATNEPVQDIESSIRPQGNKVTGINHSRNSGLSQKQKLWKYTD